MDTSLSIVHPFKMFHYLAVAMVIGQSMALSTNHTTAHENNGRLFLTPLLEAGYIQKAQRLSYVESSTIPPSHSGFITTDRSKGNHLFFWYFPSQEVKDAPLLIWLDGGPGLSSMSGLFFGNGPIEIHEDGSADDNGSYIFRKRNTTWVGKFSMLYIDQPVGTGYSFSETGSYPTSQADYTRELAFFIEQFYIIFLDHSRPLYIGGSSYAGKYVPAVAHLIHTKIQDGSSKLPLKGIYIASPFFDPETMLDSFYDLPYVLGAISHHDMVNFKKAANNMYRQYDHKGEFPTSVNEMMDILSPREISSRLNFYNFVEPLPYSFRLSIIQKVMESEVMRALLHTGNEGKHLTSHRRMLEYLLKEFFQGTKKELGLLMDNYKVLIISGNYDVIVSAVMVETALMSTPWSMQSVYNTSTRLAWWGEPSSIEGNSVKLNGFYTHVGNLCRVVLSSGGHFALSDRPEASLELMEDFVLRGCVGVDGKNEQTHVQGEPGQSSVGRAGSSVGYVVTFVLFTIPCIKWH